MTNIFLPDQRSDVRNDKAVLFTYSSKMVMTIFNLRIPIFEEMRYGSIKTTDDWRSDKLSERQTDKETG